MLYEFLAEHKKEIIQLCKEKVAVDAKSKPTSARLEEGLPIFYEELIGVLQNTATTDSNTDGKEFRIQNKIKEGGATAHGKESLHLGYTISQVVHSYGSICQSITQYAQKKDYEITSREFQDLNLSLDSAIAEAVTEYEKVQSLEVDDDEVERLGFLMHEMRNALSSASAAYQMIQRGSVGVSGVTSEILGRSHERMQNLIKSAEAEIRFRGHATVERTQIRLIDLVNEVNSDAMIKGRSEEGRLIIDIDPSIQLTADRHLLFSALSNLMNNAVKFTKKDGNVWVRGKNSGQRILIEIEDECGGIPGGKIEELFAPFIQKGPNKTGMGLGLSLSRRAIELNKGTLTGRDIPGKGCVFTINLPKS